jgi:hypothetical protein
MKTIFFIVALIFTITYWTEMSNFVSGNLSTIGSSAAKWLVEHTPKK